MRNDENAADDRPLTRLQKRDWARHLFLTEPGIMQKEVAARVGISVNTMSKWARAGKWEELRASAVAGKSALLTRLYRRLAELNDAVEARPPGERAVSGSDVATISKLSAAIRNLETETNIADKMDVGREFLAWARKSAASADELRRLAALFDGFIKSCL